VVARVALLVVAVAALGWLAVSIGSSAAQDELIRLGFRIGPPPDRERVQELADRARVLSPDRRADLAEGVALQRAGDRAGAVRAFRRAARAEPESIEAWALLERVAEPELAAEARRRVRELAPPVP
jgi:Flp pilus assembly protein TadD